jgi:co-chaperonin GroES (HSP10)
MPTYDPTKLRVKDGWISILADERATKVGLIELPFVTSVEKVTEGMATVIRCGVGKKNETIGIQSGDRIAYRSYLKYANPIETDEKWPSGTPKEYAIVSVDSVIAILDPGAVVGVFSSPAAHAVDSVSEDGTVKMKR